VECKGKKKDMKEKGELPQIEKGSFLKMLGYYFLLSCQSAISKCNSPIFYILQDCFFLFLWLLRSYLKVNEDIALVEKVSY
jgi:hypothetical protein